MSRYDKEFYLTDNVDIFLERSIYWLKHGHTKKGIKLTPNIIKFTKQNDTLCVDKSQHHGSAQSCNFSAITNKSRLYIDLHGENDRQDILISHRSGEIPITTFVNFLAKELTHPSLKQNLKQKLKISLLVCYGANLTGEDSLAAQMLIELYHANINCEIVARVGRVEINLLHHSRIELQRATQSRLKQPLDYSKVASDFLDTEKAPGSKYLLTMSDGKIIIVDIYQESAYKIIRHEIIPMIRICLIKTYSPTEISILTHIIDDLHALADNVLYRNINDAGHQKIEMGSFDETGLEKVYKYYRISGSSAAENKSAFMSIREIVRKHYDKKYKYYNRQSHLSETIEKVMSLIKDLIGE